MILLSRVKSIITDLVNLQHVECDQSISIIQTVLQQMMSLLQTFDILVCKMEGKQKNQEISDFQCNENIFHGSKFHFQNLKLA